MNSVISAAGRLFIAVILVFCTFRPAAAVPYDFKDAHLLNNAFDKTPSTGDGYILDRAPLTGGGVTFTLMLGPTGDGKTLFGDSYPIDPTAGMHWDNVLYHYTSLAPYSGLKLNVYYASGPADLIMSLYMNTGLIGPSGYPSNDWRNDTFWCGSWQTLSVGNWFTLDLDFNNAHAYNLLDNPEPHTQPPSGFVDGDLTAINDRDRHEVSNLGFQLAFSGNPDFRGPIVLHVNVVPEPATIVLLGVGLAGLGFIRRRRR